MPDRFGRRFKTRPVTEQGDRSESRSVDPDRRRSVSDFIRLNNPKAFEKIKLETLDSCYRIPKVDHSYHIRETPIIKPEKQSDSYMNQVIRRARSSVDPRKYSEVVDWKARSASRLPGKMARTKKETIMAELMRDKKSIPGPSVYQNWNKPRAKGFYGKISPRITVMEETMYEKKRIPSSTQYNTFKGFSKEVIERNKKRMSQAYLDGKRKDFAYFKLKKTNQPGPSTYETAKSIDRCSLRSSIQMKWAKAKKTSFLRKYLAQSTCRATGLREEKRAGRWVVQIRRVSQGQGLLMRAPLATQAVIRY